MGKFLFDEFGREFNEFVKVLDVSEFQFFHSVLSFFFYDAGLSRCLFLFFCLRPLLHRAAVLGVESRVVLYGPGGLAL